MAAFQSACRLASVSSAEVAARIHDAFDSVDAFPACAKVIGDIRDQSNCGSCWAFGSVAAMTDRTGIQSGGKSAPHLSAQDVTSCCHLGDMGCFGGIPPTAYIYWTTTGVVTGGNYGDASMCYSYEKEPCAHHANSSKYPDCETADIPQRTPACAPTSTRRPPRETR